MDDFPSPFVENYIFGFGSIDRTLWFDLIELELVRLITKDRIHTLLKV